LKGDREKSLAAGMDDHLSKPFTIDQLKEIMAKHLLLSDDVPDRKLPVNGGPPSLTHRELAEDDTGENQTPGFDRKALDRIQALDAPESKELVRTVITHYFDETPKIIESIKSAMIDNDSVAIMKLAHSLKSSSANVGALALSAACKEMEGAGRANALAGCPGLLAWIEKEYRSANMALTAEL
jgi:two-component system, sensor histidine kinase and response regulator